MLVYQRANPTKTIRCLGVSWAHGPLGSDPRDFSGLTGLVFQMERHEAIDPSATPKTRFPGRKHSTNAPKISLRFDFA